MQERTEDIFVPEETLLGGHFNVKGTLESTSSEAQPHLCSWRGQIYVAKVFYDKSRLDKGIAAALTQVESPYVARTLKTGSYDGHPYMIYPYYKHGSVTGQRFSMEDLRERVVPQLNRGLWALHARNIVDTDLKPSNIMVGTGGRDLLITDYGRTAVKALDGSESASARAASPCMAPEARQGRPVPASDYYSLGATVYELHTGRQLPMNPEDIAYALDSSGMPQRLKDLITGLTYEDLSYQGDARNPNKRWTYQEVNQWCEGEEPPVPVAKAQRVLNIPPYMFESEQYSSVDDLAQAMAEMWDAGKRHLFDSTLADFFENVDAEAARLCLQAEEEALGDPAREDGIYFETLYHLSPNLEDIYWRGENLGLPEQIDEMILFGSPPEELTAMCEQHALSSYMYARAPLGPDAMHTLREAEDAYVRASGPSERKVASLTLGRVLTGDYDFSINNMNFTSLDQFANWCLALRKKDPITWRQVSSRLVPLPGRLSDDFCAWLMALGNTDAISTWQGGRGADAPSTPAAPSAKPRTNVPSTPPTDVDERAATLADEQANIRARIQSLSTQVTRAEEAELAASAREPIASVPRSAAPPAPQEDSETSLDVLEAAAVADSPKERAKSPQSEEDYFKQVRQYVKMRQRELLAESEERGQNRDSR